MWDKDPAQREDWQFVETPRFTRIWVDFFETDRAFAAFQSHLKSHPAIGEVIPGGGGLRKVRWTDPRRAKGKRGGLRIIYLLISEVRVIVLMNVYDKTRVDDMTPAEKHAAARLTTVYRDDLIAQFAARRIT